MTEKEDAIEQRKFISQLSKCQDFECRGWKEICFYLKRDKRTAKKRLKRMGLLTYDGTEPFLNKLVYQKASLKLQQQLNIKK